MCMWRVESRTCALGRQYCHSPAMTQPRQRGREAIARAPPPRRVCSQAAATQEAAVLSARPQVPQQGRRMASRSRSCCSWQARLRAPRFQFATGRMRSRDAISWEVLGTEVIICSARTESALPVHVQRYVSCRTAKIRPTGGRLAPGNQGRESTRQARIGTTRKSDHLYDDLSRTI